MSDLKGNTLSVLFRAGISTIIVLAYFHLLRPARIAFTKKVAHPSIQKTLNKKDDMTTSLVNNTLLISYTIYNKSKALYYRPEFGFFFLLAGFFLIFLTSDPLPFKLLGALHAIATVFIFGFLMLGASGYKWGFILVDAIGGYLTPALSLAIVPLVMSGKLSGSELKDE